jgi:putative FmdB family regulatory protein
MPLYDYGCPSCNNQQEVQHSMSEIGKVEVICDHCGARMRKKLSMPTLIGFDDVGRSISKKDKTEKKSGEATPKKESAVKKDAA